MDSAGRLGKIRTFTRVLPLKGVRHIPNCQDINLATDPPDKSWEFVFNQLLLEHLTCTYPTCSASEPTLAQWERYSEVFTHIPRKGILSY